MASPDKYFQPTSGYFWQWEEGGEVAAIPNGNTIAYRALIAEVLDGLYMQGIPPLGTLLLAILATNPQGRESINAVRPIVDGLLVNNDYSMEDAFALLELLAAMPREYKEGKKRILLFRAIFEGAHNLIAARKAALLLQQFRAGNRLHTVRAEKSYNTHILATDFRPLELIYKRLKSTEDIIARIAALPNIEEPIKLEEQEGNNTANTAELVEQLIDNPKTFHVGVLIRRIWSGLNIPVHSSLPSEQPLGGVADLTNKGSFDRLLISEYANDDLVLLSRLANNEALYLHRETPPAKNNMHRVILLDVSLKNWGTPRIVAFATMLAIARHPKSDYACSAYVVGNGYTPISIDNTGSIIDALQLLGGNLHGAEGITAYLQEHTDRKNIELFVFTGSSTLKYAAMLRLRHEEKDIKYWIHTDAQGAIEIYRRQQGGLKQVQHIQLPLAELWNRKKVNSGQNDKVDSGNTKLPILVRNTGTFLKALSTTDGFVYVINKEGLLIRHRKNAHYDYHGWELMQEQLPVMLNSIECEIAMCKNGTTILLILDTASKTLTLTDVLTGEKKELLFSDWGAKWKQSFIFLNDKFYHNNATGTWSIDALSGEIRSREAVNYELFLKRETELAELDGPLIRKGSGNIFKNVSSVFINEAGNLVFNVHELLLKNNHGAYLEKTGFLKVKVAAEKSSDSEFLFPDGSRVAIKKMGIIVLQSSDKGIPDIYISSEMNITLGMAAGDEFAGNSYFKKDQKDITMPVFFEKYIGAYIKHIIKVNDITLMAKMHDL